MPPLETCSVTDYGNLFNQDSYERTLDRRRSHVTRHSSGGPAEVENGRLRIINTPMGLALIAELNSFEVDFASAGTWVDVRSKVHPGNLVIATRRALWSAVGRP
jgi:hypothetical protein